VQICFSVRFVRHSVHDVFRRVPSSCSRVFSTVTRTRTTTTTTTTTRETRGMLPLGILMRSKLRRMRFNWLTKSARRKKAWLLPDGITRRGSAQVRPALLPCHSFVPSRARYTSLPCTSRFSNTSRSDRSLDKLTLNASLSLSLPTAIWFQDSRLRWRETSSNAPL